MAVERYGSKTDVVVKLILVFFISLLSFSIGTFVGKKFSDNQHKISQLEPGVIDKDDATHDEHSVAAAGTSETKSEALTDDEISKLAEEFVTDDEKPGRGVASENEESHGTKAKAEDETSHSPKKDEVKVELKTKHDEKAPEKTAEKKAEHKSEAKHEEKTADHKTDKVAAVADKVAAGKPASEGEKHVEKKSGPATSLPKDVAASASGKFTVQVASYPKEDEAQGMAADLKNKGFSAFYIPAQVKGQTWYRVSVGLFTTQKEAQAYREDLLARAKVSSAIVQKITQ